MTNWIFRVMLVAAVMSMLAESIALGAEANVSAKSKTSKTGKTINPQQADDFPKDLLGVYIAETLNLVTAYPLNWKIGKAVDTSDASGAPEFLRPKELLNVAWVQPGPSSSAVHVSVQKPFTTPKPYSEMMDEIATKIGQQLRDGGMSFVTPTIAEAVGTKNYRVHGVPNLCEGAIFEGTNNEAWQFVLVTTNRGLLYMLTLTTDKANLDKHFNLFQLIVRNFGVNAFLAEKPYGKAMEALSKLSTENAARPVIFSCGIITSEKFSVMPDGSGMKRFGPANGLNWVVRAGGDIVYCTLPFEEGIFAFNMQNYESPKPMLSVSDVLSFDVSPDGHEICYCGMMSKGLIITAIDKPSPRVVTQERALCPKWSPDGKTIAFHDAEKKIRFFDLKKEVVGTLVNAKGMSVEWLPDSSGFLFCDKNTIKYFNKVDMQIETIVDTEGEKSYPHVSHDGRYIAYSAARNDSRSIYIWDRENKVEVLLFSNVANCDVLDW